MSGVLHLCNVLEFIIHRFNDSPFSEQQFVREAHQRPFHVAFQFGNELYAINEKSLKDILADISLVAYQLAVNELYEGFVFQRFSVVDVSGCYHEVEQFSLLIAYQMQFKTEEPTHGAFPPLGNTPEHPVNVYSLVPADAKWRTVNKTDACAFAQENLLDKQSQWDGDLPFQFYKAVVRDYLGEQMAQVPAHLLKIEMLQATIARIMEENHDNHDFRL